MPDGLEPLDRKVRMTGPEIFDRYRDVQVVEGGRTARATIRDRGPPWSLSAAALKRSTGIDNRR
jgi:hypothetical protein